MTNILTKLNNGLAVGLPGTRGPFVPPLAETGTEADGDSAQTPP